MQRGLIDHGTAQERIAIFFQRVGQSLKPLYPLAAQMTFDPNLIDRWLVGITFRATFAWHPSVPQ